MGISTEIENAFEIADDGMQGVLGYYLYVKGCQEAAEESEVLSKLPDNLNITPDWFRNYSKDALCRSMKKVFPLLHARVTLISIIHLFEGALNRFTEKLCKDGHMHPVKRGYKKKLIWAFEEALKSYYMADVPNSFFYLREDACLQVDHARRIRNLWTHNNGMLNQQYRSDAIPVAGRNALVLSGFDEIMELGKPVAINFNPDNYEMMVGYHIGLLHYLHNTIQIRYYDSDYLGYSYHDKIKTVIWERCLIGA